MHHFHVDQHNKGSAIFIHFNEHMTLITLLWVILPGVVCLGIPALIVWVPASAPLAPNAGPFESGAWTGHTYAPTLAQNVDQTSNSQPAFTNNVT